MTQYDYESAGFGGNGQTGSSPGIQSVTEPPNPVAYTTHARTFGTLTVCILQINRIAAGAQYERYRIALQVRSAQHSQRTVRRAGPRNTALTRIVDGDGAIEERAIHAPTLIVAAPYGGEQSGVRSRHTDSEGLPFYFGTMKRPSHSTTFESNSPIGSEPSTTDHAKFGSRFGSVDGSRGPAGSSGCGERSVPMGMNCTVRLHPSLSCGGSSRVRGPRCSALNHSG
jgi:hypothetical protein